MIPGSGRSPGGGHGNPLQGNTLLPGESQGQRSLAGCSPQGLEESDTTEATERTQPSICESSMCTEVKLFYYFKIFTISHEESMKGSMAFCLLSIVLKKFKWDSTEV